MDLLLLLSSEPRLGKDKIWGCSFGTWQRVYLYIYISLCRLGPFFRRETESNGIQRVPCLGSLCTRHHYTLRNVPLPLSRFSAFAFCFSFFLFRLREHRGLWSVCLSPAGLG